MAAVRVERDVGMHVDAFRVRRVDELRCATRGKQPRDTVSGAFVDKRDHPLLVPRKIQVDQTAAAAPQRKPSVASLCHK